MFANRVAIVMICFGVGLFGTSGGLGQENPAASSAAASSPAPVEQTPARQEATPAPASQPAESAPSAQAQAQPGGSAAEATAPPSQAEPAAPQTLGTGRAAVVPAESPPPVTTPAAEAKAPPRGEPTAQPAEATQTESPGVKPERPAIPNLREILSKLRAPEGGAFKKVGEVCTIKHWQVGKLHGYGLAIDLADLARSGTTISRPPVIGGITPQAGAAARTESVTGSFDLKSVLALLEVEGGENLLAAIPEPLWTQRKLLLVSVTVEVPAEGARKGDRVDCHVRAFEPKSLEGCYLLPTKLFPPGPREGSPVGVAAGPITADSGYTRAGSEKVARGCLLQVDVADQFVKEGKVTLVLNPDKADFVLAQEIADRINLELGLMSGKPLAKAINKAMVEVEIPQGFVEDPVAFITQLLQMSTSIPADTPGSGTPGGVNPRVSPLMPPLR